MNIFTIDSLILVFLILILYFVIMKIIHNEKKKLNNQNSNTSPTPVFSNYNFKDYYEPKRYIITKNELNFYKSLMEVASELNLVVFSQVSLYNIIHTKKGLDKYTKEKFFRKISQKSIDFVLADPENCRIKLCIELDDNTHQLPDRVERDNFINELFRQLEIDLLRYPVYDNYYKQTLKKRIIEVIKDHYYIN